MMDSREKSLGRSFSIIYRLGQSHLDRVLKPYNLGSGQAIYIFALLRQDGVTQEYLSQLLKIDKGTTARALKKLEKEGYIFRKNDPKDKRANLIMLTEKALAMKFLFVKISRDWTENLVQGFSEEEKEMAFILLRKMVINAINHSQANSEQQKGDD